MLRRAAVDRRKIAVYLSVAGGLYGGAMLTSLVIGIASLVFDFGGDGVIVMLFVGAAGTAVGCLPVAAAVMNAPRAAPAAAPVGALLAVGVLHFYGGQGVGPVWSAAHDHPSGVRAVGSWTTEDIVVRARPDEVSGYRIADGTVVWRWSPPGQEVVCAMSEGVRGSIGLIGHATTKTPCAAVTALDLSSGRSTWQGTVRPAVGRWGDEAQEGIVAIAGGTAVVRETDGWRGMRLADGSALWSVKAEPDCAPKQLAGGPDAVVTVELCSGRSLVVRSLTPGNGRQLSRTALPIAGDNPTVAVLSTAPVTVAVDDNTLRGTHTVLALDRQGRIRSRVPLSGPEYDLTVTLSTPLYGFTARPVRGALVVGDVLVAPAVKPGDRHAYGNGRWGPSVDYDGRLVAFSLTDSTRKWTAELDGQVQGIALDSTGLWALTDQELTRIDPRTGHRTSNLTIHNTRQLDPVQLWALDGLFACVTADGTDDDPPVQVLG
ncbi:MULTISPECIES: PQQ-binding-like beta-propeller repeat protein [unclassified Streptomyces]|uniref:outer membrane protein assembly factor BamB family protein n=1 Tax=unclassified Streptomyces TaxID=2593676 RepID=UPI0035DBDB17